MNITLIGMSGVGKSRIGKLLAKKLHYRFVDVDRIIENANHQRLQELIDCLGDKKFIEIEEKAVLSIGNACNTVISPGGSAIYSEKAMKFLKDTSTVVFFNASLDEIKKRTVNFSDRGIVGLKEVGLERLFEQRLPLYRKYADVTIDIDNCDNEAVVNILIQKMQIK